MGELAIVPAEDIENHTTLPTSCTGFQFPNPNIYENAQIAESLASQASFSLAPRMTSRPSRLIDVGSDDVVLPKLVPMQELDKMELDDLRYLTLSHCWGGAEILRLLVQNIDDLKSGIEKSTLPQTFQHAIVTTRELGYRYLWIDSLCIIQDSPQDWAYESQFMGEIYANSICTIAALAARNSHEGCFFDNTRNPLFFRPCRLLDDLYVEANSNIGVDLRKGLSPLPLHTRAWVVQERILAPRTVYYGSMGLAWECVDCSATEAIPWGEKSRFSPKASFFDIQQENNEEKYYSNWIDIQISYTRCSLTRFDDRLVAILGVIQRIQSLTGWENVWGMWRNRLLMEMLWFVEEPARRPETGMYLSPTWSWVGIEGRVMMAVGVQEQKRWAAEVVDVGLAEERGYVRLKAAMRGVKCTAACKLNGGKEMPLPKWEEVDWDPDTISKTDGVEEMACLLIARLPEYLGPGSEAFDIGLVVRRSRGEEWSRIGLFRQLREGDAALFPKNLAELQLKEITVV
ncbi:uncharacterized protein FIBRA_08020 [Fibroporia radiculosa]|uniref:Heterokaryon incompatibility domain-containing protein n=1 Tax=Fibroporia radiculosa TaxID=599839 RepID=J4I1X9_9APHY|nr:uncharacterized protein FIBRA_08020 [Fibroporia radiculosa]CCM05787.1 predicted protein [Fibroporia radiculosa]